MSSAEAPIAAAADSTQANAHLHKLVFGRNPASDIPSFPLVLIALLTAVGCGFLGTGFVHADKSFYLPAGVALISALTLSLHMTHVRNAGMRRYAETLDQAIDEVISLRDSIANYLRDLDARTSRYFHCVTNTKVTGYFMLRQIEQNLTLLVEKITAMATDMSPSRLLAAHEMLSSPLQYSDSLTVHTGTLHQEPLPQLFATVHQLMHELSLGIEVLEEEIAVVKSETPGESDEEAEQG